MQQGHKTIFVQSLAVPHSALQDPLRLCPTFAPKCKQNNFLKSLVSYITYMIDNFQGTETNQERICPPKFGTGLLNSESVENAPIFLLTQSCSQDITQSSPRLLTSILLDQYHPAINA
jgi:hypothetical protein